MIIYFFIVAVGSFVAGRLILGELRKERRDYVVLVSPSLESPQNDSSVTSVGEYIPPSDYLPQIKSDHAVKNLSDWERVLAEKNQDIENLTRQLESQKAQTQDIEKIKVLLERQIFESRQMNRAIKREFDALRAQDAKSQDEIAKLQVELNYKNQLINQNEVKMIELKNRISKILPNEIATSAQEPIHNPELDLGDFSFDQLDWRNKINE